jgi:hypothetical protein
MADEEIEEILHAVAEGDMSAEEAARRLEVIRTAREMSGDATRELPRSTETGPIAKVRVNANAGVVRITGDRDVREAVVEGSHTLERHGDELVVECAPLLRTFGREDPVGAYASGSDRPRRRFGLSLFGDHHPIRVRMNPELALEVELVAGSLAIDRVTGPITANINAASASLKRVRGPIDCSINAGSLSISGVLSEGTSRVSSDMAAVAIKLEPGSDVRVHATTTLGRTDVRLPRGDGGDWVMGSGRGELIVHCNMSSVSVDEA